MSFDKRFFKSVSLHEFNGGNSARGTAKKINEQYGNKSVSTATVIKWFNKFRNGNFQLDRVNGSGRPRAISDNELLDYVNAHPFMTLQEFADHFSVTKPAILYRLKLLGYSNKKTRWIPHQLSAKNLNDRCTIFSQLLEMNKREPFLDYIVTSDEKWIEYSNIERKLEWSLKGSKPTTSAKPPLHGKKVMICVWWDIHGIIHHEFLKPNETVTASKYCEQLDDLHEALKLKRPALINRGKLHILHDNAPAHAAIITKSKLKGLKWRVLPHPPYSPDAAPSDFHLFRAMDNSLRKKKFNTFVELEKFVENWFNSRPKDFYKKGIHKLPKIWQEVIENKGAYL